MKLDLQENMYVRTKYGISQYKYYDISNGKLLCIPVKDGSRGIFADVEDIIKASYNIIDILEVGDFLDNHCIIKIENDTCYLNDGWFINADDIENLITSICTKEQFEQMSYKLEE